MLLIIAEKLPQGMTKNRNNNDVEGIGAVADDELGLDYSSADNTSVQRSL